MSGARQQCKACRQAARGGTARYRRQCAVRVVGPSCRWS
jgi:hypothetical protein